jgi:sulfocyanin
MNWDAVTKTVTLQITAGATAANSKWNFNGASHGGLTITVPIGSRVVIEFTNNDAGNAHSVGVVVPKEPVPASGDAMTLVPATAFTIPFVRGSPRGRPERIEFRADKAGGYWLFCGVPPHGTGGMYVNFVVSKAAKVPSTLIRKP